MSTFLPHSPSRAELIFFLSSLLYLPILDQKCSPPPRQQSPMHDDARSSKTRSDHYHLGHAGSVQEE